MIDIILFQLDWGNSVVPLVTGVLFFAVAYFVFKSQEKTLQKNFQKKEEQLKTDIESLQRELEDSSKEELNQLQLSLEEERSHLVSDLKETQAEVDDMRREVEKRERALGGREKRIKSQEADLAGKEEKLAQQVRELEGTLTQEKEQLLAIADMTREEARELLLKQIESECDQEKADIVHRVVTESREEADHKAKEIIAESLIRCASEQTAASTVSTVDLPSDDMKGRIIGREGRNIKAFERITGTDVIIDDTPGVIVLSAFDAVRREIAVRSMSKLLSDGRIHPARIEDVVKSMRREVEKQTTEHGQQAVFDLNIQGLNQKIHSQIGQMNYKVFRGQNLLKMSQNISSLCGAIAAEFGLDANRAKTAGLLSFIGMTESQEIEGSVAHVGSQIARRFGCHRDVVTAIASASDQSEPQTLYGVILQVAVKISRSRPGASHEQVQRYIKRMEDIEKIATDFDGVKEVYAIQAGNELRVVVDPVKVNDKAALKIARDIAKNIELNATYPGSIVVNLLRESRSVSYAR